MCGILAVLCADASEVRFASQPQSKNSQKSALYPCVQQIEQELPFLRNLHRRGLHCLAAERDNFSLLLFIRAILFCFYSFAPYYFR